VVFVLVLFFF